MTAETKEEADRRLRTALVEIERAQREIGKATSLLASCVGVLPNWRALGKLYDQIQKEWHRLNGRLGSPQVDLDDLSKDSFQKLAKEQEKEIPF